MPETSASSLRVDDGGTHFLGFNGFASCPPSDVIYFGCANGLPPVCANGPGHLIHQTTSCKNLAPARSVRQHAFTLQALLFQGRDL